MIQENNYPIEKLKELILQSRNIVIGTHLNADGDAVGSTLAMAMILRKLGKNVHVVTPNDYPGFLQWMAGSDMMLIYRSAREQVL